GRQRPAPLSSALAMNYRALERVAFRTVLFVAALILVALAFRQLATLAVAVLATVLIAILLDTAARRLERRGIPRKAGALIMLIIAYYMAANPEPLLNGLRRLFPPERREHVEFVMTRLRDAWVGWMQGVIVNMLVTGVLVYVGLTLIGLDYALVFGVISGLF